MTNNSIEACSMNAAILPRSSVKNKILAFTSLMLKSEYKVDWRVDRNNDYMAK